MKWWLLPLISALGGKVKWTFEAGLVHRVLGQWSLHREILSQTKQNNPPGRNKTKQTSKWMNKSHIQSSREVNTGTQEARKLKVGIMKEHSLLSHLWLIHSQTHIFLLYLFFLSFISIPFISLPFHIHLLPMQPPSQKKMKLIEGKMREWEGKGNQSYCKSFSVPHNKSFHPYISSCKCLLQRVISFVRILWFMLHYYVGPSLELILDSLLLLCVVEIL